MSLMVSGTPVETTVPKGCGPGSIVSIQVPAPARDQQTSGPAPIAIQRDADVAAVTDREPPGPQFWTSGDSQVTLKPRPNWELHRVQETGKICFFDPANGTTEFCTLHAKHDGSNVMMFEGHEEPIGGWAVGDHEEAPNGKRSKKQDARNENYWGPRTCAACVCCPCCLPCLCCHQLDARA